MINNASPIEIEIESTEITTIDQLAQSLAGHTRLISDEIIMPALKQSRDYKPIIEFFHSVQKHLIHSPDEPEPKMTWLVREITNSKSQISTYSAVFKNVRGGDTLIVDRIPGTNFSMKTKEFNKKLTLKKRTISDLNNLQMAILKGGDDTLRYTVCRYTCIPFTCDYGCS